MNTIPFTFCNQQADYEKANAVIIQIPYDATTCYVPGTRFGPHEIIKASKDLEFYDHDLDLYPTDLGIHTKDELVVYKAPGKMVDTIKEAVAEVLKDDKIPVILGGEHSVSIGAVQAVAEKFENLSILHIDAHADMEDSFEGTKFHHACVSRRFFESCTSISQIGIRNISEEGRKFANDNGINIQYAPSYDIPRLLAGLNENVYITLDLDSLDPSVMPAVGTPEPGGMNWYELMHVLENVIKTKNVVGFDINELNPMVTPGNHMSAFTASKILNKMFGYVLRKENSEN